jgi:hypothetical protein
MRGDRGARYARTIVNAHWQEFWRGHGPRALRAQCAKKRSLDYLT